MATLTAFGSGGLSAEQWAKKLQNNEINAQREQQAKDQAIKLGKNTYSWSGADGSFGMGTVDGSDGTNTNKSYQQFAGGNPKFGSNGAFGSMFGESFNNAFSAAKDLSNFNLGLTKDLSRFNWGLRNDEFNENFRRQSALEGQQQGATQKLEDTRQGAETLRLEKQLGTQREMQNTDLGFQRDMRARETALALRGFR